MQHNPPYYAASWAPTTIKGIGKRESRSYFPIMVVWAALAQKEPLPMESGTAMGNGASQVAQARFVQVVSGIGLLPTNVL